MSPEKVFPRRLVYAIFSIAVTAGVFGWLFTHVSPKEILEIIVNADGRAVAAFLILSLSMNAVKTWRYGMILRASGCRPSSTALFLTVLVRNLFSDLLPARLGTLVYIYIVKSRLGVPIGAAVSSFALAFLFDMIALAPLLLAALLFVGSGSTLPAGAVAAMGLALLLVTAVTLVLLPQVFGVARGFIGAVSTVAGGRLEKLSEGLASAGEEIRRSRDTGIYGRLVLLSLLGRIFKYGSLYFFLYALVFPLGYGFATLAVPKVFLGLCASELAASLPVSGIAGFGAYEGAWAIVFQLLGFSSELARLTSISHHLFTQSYGYSLGVAAALLLLLPLFRRDADLPVSPSEKSSPLRFYLQFSLTIAVTAGALVLVFASR